MSKLLKDCDYDKHKLVHDLSRIAWFLEKHAKSDAGKEGHDDCARVYEELKADIEKHLEKLNAAIK